MYIYYYIYIYICIYIYLDMYRCIYIYIYIYIGCRVGRGYRELRDAELGEHGGGVRVDARRLERLQEKVPSVENRFRMTRERLHRSYGPKAKARIWPGTESQGQNLALAPQIWQTYDCQIWQI